MKKNNTNPSIPQDNSLREEIYVHCPGCNEECYGHNISKELKEAQLELLEKIFWIFYQPGHSYWFLSRDDLDKLKKEVEGK